MNLYNILYNLIINFKYMSMQKINKYKIIYFNSMGLKNIYIYLSLQTAIVMKRIKYMQALIITE